MSLNTDSSPFQSSPAEGTTSPRMFWHNRNSSTENSLYGDRLTSPSPLRRSSLERLQKASRVKNSNILALEQKREYDPTHVPHIERPLAKVQGNAFGGRGSAGLHSDTSISSQGTEKKGHSHKRSQSKTDIPLYSPSKADSQDSSDFSNPPRTPTKDQTSPIKSSMSTSRFKSSFDENTGTWVNEPSSEGRFLHRHTKSVTFDNGPPQVNEYEMATPDLSSIGSNSREGSYDTDEDDDYEHYYHHHHHHHDLDLQEDSFDASLEDTDKTPVVGPDDWKQDSLSRGDDPFYDSSPAPDSAASRASPGCSPHQRSDSRNSNGDHRPLPPLPGMNQSGGSYPRDSPSSPRSLPSPPPASASPEAQNIGNGKMSLEERLKLMMLSDDNNGAKTAAERQRERRMRRAATRDRFSSPMSETDNASQGPTEADEEDDTIGDLSGLDYQLPPRISRESILRRVNGKTFERESDYHFSSPPPASSPERHLPLDPDVPIPSTEEDSMVYDEESSVIIRPELAQHEEFDDTFSMRDTPVAGDDSIVIHEDNDAESASNYSAPSASQDIPAPLAARDPTSQDDTTPLASPCEKEVPSETDTDTAPPILNGPTLPKPDETTGKRESLSMVDAHAFLQRPFTPEQKTLSKPEYDGSGWGEPEEYERESTPESVIHHPVSDFEDEEVEHSEEEIRLPSPDIPERVATIKASGSKLKTRPSATPSDIMAMREARRQVSREVPDVPPIPDRHRNRLSTDMQDELDNRTEARVERQSSFHKRSLTLDLDMGLSLDKDFDRVIENQKVAFNHIINQKAHSTAKSPTRQASGLNKTQNKPPKKPQVNLERPQSANVNDHQQRGYLMRQNTKLVAASDKESDDSWKTRSAGNSPIKADRPQSWTVEPWNGRVRQRSHTAAARGPVPPMPGFESNAVGLNPLAEEETGAEIASADSGERGRLFVKVMGVKDLDLPISKSKSPALLQSSDSVANSVIS